MKIQKNQKKTKISDIFNILKKFHGFGMEFQDFSEFSFGIIFMKKISKKIFIFKNVFSMISTSVKPVRINPKAPERSTGFRG